MRSYDTAARDHLFHAPVTGKRHESGSESSGHHVPNAVNYTLYAERQKEGQKSPPYDERTLQISGEFTEPPRVESDECFYGI